MAKAVLNLEEGGAIIVVSPQGTLGGAVYDLSSGSKGALLGHGIVKAMANEAWVTKVCQRVEEIGES